MNKVSEIRITGLIAKLESEDWIVREDALEILGELGKNNQKVTSAIIGILMFDEIPYVRNKAAEVLGYLEDKAAIPALIKCLENDSVEDVRAITVETLGKLKATEALKAITTALFQDESNWVQEKSIEALIRIGSKKAIRELVSILKAKYDIRIIDAIVELLFTMNIEEKLVLLEDIRETQTQALIELNNRIIRKLAKEQNMGEIFNIIEKKEELLLSALEILEKKAIADENIIQKMWVLFEESKHEETRIAITKIFGIAQRDKSIQKLLDIAQNDKSSRVSAQAIHSLGEFGERASCISDILASLFLKNTNDWIRYNVIVALGKIKQISEEKIEELGKLLLTEKNDEIRFEIAKSLEEIGRTAQIVEPELIQALGTETKEIIQIQLIKTIGELQIQNTEASNLLRKILEESNNVFVRIFSALSLGRIGEENSIEALLKVKNEESSVEISRAIEWALREIKRRKLLVFLLKMNPEKTLPIVDIANNANIDLEEAIELMTKILQGARKIGFYSSQEQLFRKYEGIDEFIRSMMKSKTKYPKYHTCFECSYPILIEEKICPNCKEEIPKCPICKLPISKRDYIGICEKCNVKGHLTHFREWVEVKGTCPRCLQSTKVKVITQKIFIV